MCVWNNRRIDDHKWIFDILKKTKKDAVDKAIDKISKEGKFIPIIKESIRSCQRQKIY